MTLPILDLDGSPFDMGLRHGRAFRDAIRRYAAERVALAGSEAWTGRRLSRARVLELAAASLAEHRAYAPELAEELEGMARACGLDAAELVVVGGFTDFIDTVHNAEDALHLAAPTGGRVGGGGGADPGDAATARGTAGAAAATPTETAGVDDCTAFLVPPSRAADGHGMLAQTWDMHEGSAEHLLLLRGRPRGAPAFLAYTTAGCVGMIGMNEAGLSVGINNLMGADGRVGVTWPFVVRRMLTQETVQGALDELGRARLAGGHNFLVMDATSQGANVEAMATRAHTVWLGRAPVAHTNHCLAPDTAAVQRPRDPDSQADSEARLARANALLERDAVTLGDVQAVLSDTQAICHAGTAPRFVGTCGAVVLVPASRAFWAVKGRPSRRPFERFGVA